MVARFAPLPLAICLAGLRLILCQTSFGDDYTVNDLDDYQIYERGYDTFEDEAIDNTYFNPYAGDYDDPYGDSILQDFAVIQDCQIAADGSATFNGVTRCHGSAKAGTTLCTTVLGARTFAICVCRHKALRFANTRS